MWIRSRHLAGNIAAASILLVKASIAQAGEGVPVAGTWRGDSVCTTAAPSCQSEAVVYYIADVPDRPDLVTIRADKTVDGKAITMGTGQWTHDRDHHTLEWRTTERIWLLVIKGNRIEGTLTLADGTVVRKMTLKKDE